MPVPLYYSITYYTYTHMHRPIKLDISSPINTFANKTYYVTFIYFYKVPLFVCMSRTYLWFNLS